MSAVDKATRSIVEQARAYGVPVIQVDVFRNEDEETATILAHTQDDHGLMAGITIEDSFDGARVALLNDWLKARRFKLLSS